MNHIELSAGVIEYEDTGGDGSTIVFLHGLLMDASLWAVPVTTLAAEHRCLSPVLPLGAHRRPVRPDADLSLPVIAALVREFVTRLDLHDVTVVGNDTGGALVQLLMAEDEPRIAAAVLISCDAFDNFPPGLTGRTLVRTGQLSPALFGAFMQQMRLRIIRRLPLAFGWLTQRGDAVTRRWMQPILRQREIRRDAVRALRAIAADKQLLVRVAEHLPGFHRPVLIVWASADRVMPPEHGRRLANLLPNATLVEIEDSYTLVPLDQPDLLAHHLGNFLAGLPTRQS